MKTNYPDRAFQLWEYQVSHGSLLIRSPKAPGISTNIDLVCVGVEYLALPGHVKGLELAHATEEEVRALEQLLGKRVLPARAFMFVSEGRRHPIVAVSCTISENTGDIFESPFEFPKRPR